jgi:hypothetical protein
VVAAAITVQLSLAADMRFGDLWVLAAVGAYAVYSVLLRTRPAVHPLSFLAATFVGPIWGFGDGQELRNMFTRTAQPKLWFIAGSFAQCRIASGQG